MATYLLAYHGGGMPETEKEQARVMAAWGKWYQKLGKAVVEGQDVVEKIVKVPRGRNDRPNKDVVVKSVVIERV